MGLKLAPVKKNGITLVELIVTIVITSMVALALVGFFTVERHFRKMIDDDVATIRELRHATYHMTRFLRFADPGPNMIHIRYGANPGGGGEPNVIRLNATIKGGYLTDHALYGTAGVDTNIAYLWSNIDNALRVQYGSTGGRGEVLANNITSFRVVQDSADNEKLTIALGSQVGDKPVAIETTIKILGALE